MAPGSEALDLGFSIENYYKPMLLRLRHLRMPTVCAVNGVAAGAGANIQFACDLVVAARSASFMASPNRSFSSAIYYLRGCRQIKKQIRCQDTN